MFHSSTHLCASDNGQDSCRGDSGGPLFSKENGRFWPKYLILHANVHFFSIRFTLIGVVSDGIEPWSRCENPGLYARLSDQTLEWIKNTASGTQKSTCDNPTKIGVFVIP